ncbi:Uu.00g125140.m01.CDS01 [Anthostomella pinea]|uniref:Uu.00g125140.m01.CDS01 n=1 Tax=Anthostomella pinea TaxID=933095 RepID=A0AAI8VHQ2_9PEZI|nr:Uu.00g125140.m01.CDS01 [Anthostomella pinea]
MASISRAETLRTFFAKSEAAGSKAPQTLRPLMNYDASAANAGVDALFICMSVKDHCDRDSLVTFAPSIPVVADPAAKHAIDGWHHFDRVVEMRAFSDETGSSWRNTHPGYPLPSWLTVMRLPPASHLQHCIATLWSHKDDDGENEGKGDATQHDAIVYSPHGYDTAKPTLSNFANSTPRLRVLGMLHALKDSYAMGINLAPGVDNGLAMQRLLDARH